jgi:hypothetical protein
MQVAEQEHRGTAVSRWSMSCMLSGVSWPRCGDQGGVAHQPVERRRYDWAQQGKATDAGR